jgi:voltage-gated potassium channel
MELVTIFLRWFVVGYRRHSAVLVAGAASVVLVGGVIFAATQHLPVTTGWYWALTTATTVGYGDVTPHNPSGRIVASVVMLTAIPMLGVAFALFTGTAVSEGLRRLIGMTSVEGASGFRLVVGTNPATIRVVEEMRHAGDDVVLVADVDQANVPEGVRLVRGDPTSAAVLRHARPERAADGFVTGTSDGDVLVSAVLLRELAPSLPLLALAGSPSVGEALHELGVAQVLSADELVAHTIAKSLEAPHAGSLLVTLLSSERERLVEETVPAGAPARALSALRGEREQLVLGVVHGGEVSLGVDNDPEVGPGDVLLLVEESRSRIHRS